MYPVDEPDRVLERFDLPQACTAEPRLCVLAEENRVSVAYATQKGANSPNRGVPQYAIVTFTGCRSYRCGEPGVESLSEHPLYAKGLEPYSFSEVAGSSWMRQLAANGGCRHFIFSFRNATFECAASGYSFTLFEGSGDALTARMRERNALLIPQV
jgi:hypothetical protein